MTKTVKQHMEETDQVQKLVKSANGLVTKLQAELAQARTTLEELSGMQHPKLVMRVPYGIRGNGKDVETSPAGVIDRQVKRINEILGDKV